MTLKLPDDKEFGDDWCQLLAHVAESSRYYHKFAALNSVDHTCFAIRPSYQNWMRQSKGYLRALGVTVLPLDTLLTETASFTVATCACTFCCILR